MTAQGRLSEPLLFENLPDEYLLTMAEVALHLRISYARVRVLRMQGKLPKAIKLGKIVRYKKADIVAWLKSAME